MTTVDFIRQWNASCLTPCRQIPPAELFNHHTGEPWHGGNITNIHLYEDITLALGDAEDDRVVNVNVADFLAPGLVIQIAGGPNGTPLVTSVRQNPLEPNPTRFTPQLRIYVS